MRKINFRDKERSTIEGKVIYELLRLGIYYPKLNEKEQDNYNKWVLDGDKDKRILNSERAKKKIIIPVNQRGYLISDLYLKLKLSSLIRSISQEDEKMGLKKTQTNYHPKFGYVI